MKQKFKSLLICCIAIIVAFLWIETGQAAIVVLVDSSEYIITTSNDTQIYGTKGTNHVTLKSGAVATLRNFPGNNTITIQSDSSLFTVSRSGAYVTFEGTDNTVLKMPATTTSQFITFDDRAYVLIINSTNRVMLGNQEIDLTPSSIAFWRVYDDFNDNSFNNNIWYSNDASQPSEIGGRLYLDYAGENNILIGTMSGINGVQADLQLSHTTAQDDNSDLQVGLAVLGEGNFRYSICFELSSSSNPNQAQIEIATYDNTDAANPDSKVHDYLISTAQYDKNYTFSILISETGARFFVDGVHVMDIDISSFNIDSTVDLFPFVGCWSKYDDERATGYVDNVQVTENTYTASNFNTDSSVITNQFWPLEVGYEFSLYKTSDGTLRKKGLVSEQLVKGGVSCLKLDLWGDDDFEGCLYLAQDKMGSIRTIGSNWVGSPEWIHPNSAGTVITQTPEVGEQYYTVNTFDVDGERREVVAVDETLTTSLGTLSGCVKIEMTGWGHPEWVDYAWYCPNYGWVKWEENNLNSGKQDVSVLLHP